MKRYENNKTKYDIIPQSGSSWVRVEKGKEYLALCMDEESAYQVIYQDVHSEGGSCGYLTKSDFIDVGVR